jgi:uncharacterized protein (TIGR02246 family)
MERDEQEIRQLVATWMAATKAGDIDTVLRLMADDVVFLVAGQPPMLGKESFAAASRPQSAKGPPQFEGTSEIQEIKVLGEWAFMWTRLTVVVTPPEGGGSMTRAGHTLSVLRKEKGKWVLARDANMLAAVPGQARRVEFWFEFASTYSYPAAFRIEEAAGNAGIELTWRPFLLGPIFKEQGWNDSPFNIYAAKGRYMWRDLERICEGLQIPLRQPSQFPRNGLLAARVACLFEEESWLPEFVRRVYLANFAYDRDISESAEIISILEGLDLHSDLLVAAESPEAKAKLRAQTERAGALGIFGAPTFVSENEIFWGNDRLETAVTWAQRHERSASK